ncbi:RICIN domain-containing protein [Actinoplanes sp. NPDC051470]|uniref:RICIN domain-containing protein n=1 Tax=unclassified Actinoplanes TaxID=2626549 RepID=UPI00341715EF
MTERIDDRRARWRRLLSSTRARVEVVAACLILIAFGAVAFTVVPAVADDDKKAGQRVPAEVVPAIVAAALSCPSLNPPRLAAQIMAASGFSEGGPHGNLAAMDPAAWSKWRPSPDAQATEPAEVIAALAHRTCKLAGQIRAGGLTSDLWPAAVAAERSTVDAVLKAKGVPARQEKHVDTVIAYARWYADQPEFSMAEAAAAVPSAEPAATPVPDALVPAVRAAGAVCPAVTPARVAAQLNSLSGFDAELRSGNGAEGIAQFTPELWKTYRVRKNASVWNPQDAIASMGAAMCGLTRELALVDDADPYVLALGAYQWGTKVVRQAGGMPRTVVPQLADRVMRHVAEYEKDARLTATAKAAPKTETKKLSGKPSASSPAKAAAGPAKTKKSKLKQAKPPTKGSLAPGSAGFGPYFIANLRTKLCADQPGSGAGRPENPLTQSTCFKNFDDNQEWEFQPRATDDKGHQLYWIRNIDDGLCIDPPGTGPAPDATPLVVNNCFDNDNQYFRLEPTVASGGRQYYWLRNTVSNMCLEVPGAGTAGPDTQLQMVPCLTGDDHDWALVTRDKI